MRIEHVACKAYRVPPAIPWEDATNKVNWLELIVVELHTDDGQVGVGFSYSVDIGGTAMLALIRDYLSHLVIGMNPLQYEQIWFKLQRQSRRLGTGVNSMALAAIDIAVWDLIGKHRALPLYQLLGGARESIPAYISEINLNPQDTTGSLLARVDSYIEQGFRRVKIKIGKDDIEEDIERIVRVQERLGKQGTVFVDLNQKWDAAEAFAKGARLDGLNLGWIEEPLLYHEVEAHRALRQTLRTPIALGESLHSKQQFLHYLRLDAVDFVQADVAFVGGITEWLKIAHTADAFGKKVAPHFMMELSLHLLCGVPNGYMLEHVTGGSFTELDLLETPIVVERAIGKPGDLPGHGIRFSPAKLAPLEIAPERAGGQTFTGGSK